MQLTEANVKKLAHRFVEILGTVNTVPPACALLDKENMVRAVRIIREREIYYRIQVEGVQICELKASEFKANGKYYTDQISPFVHFFIKGCESFIAGTIETEVGKILDSIRDPLFKNGLFYGKIDISFHTVDAFGWDEKFIDIHYKNELEYSAPFHFTNEKMLGDELYRLVNNEIVSGRIIVLVP
jgi:hypothetical protein